MSNSVITIIGGGASSVAFIYSLLEGLGRSGCYSSVSLFLIDRQSQCGRGARLFRGLHHEYFKYSG